MRFELLKVNMSAVVLRVVRTVAATLKKELWQALTRLHGVRSQTTTMWQGHPRTHEADGRWLTNHHDKSTITPWCTLSDGIFELTNVLGNWRISYIRRNICDSFEREMHRPPVSFTSYKGKKMTTMMIIILINNNRVSYIVLITDSKKFECFLCLCCKCRLVSIITRDCSQKLILQNVQWRGHLVIYYTLQSGAKLKAIYYAFCKNQTRFNYL